MLNNNQFNYGITSPSTWYRKASCGISSPPPSVNIKYRPPSGRTGAVMTIGSEERKVQLWRKARSPKSYQSWIDWIRSKAFYQEFLRSYRQRKNQKRRFQPRQLTLETLQRSNTAPCKCYSMESLTKILPIGLA